MMGSLYESNADLLAALCILAPEGNVRVALVGLIDFLEGTEEDIVFDRRAIFEVIARGVVQMNFEMGEQDDDSSEDFTGQSSEEIIEQFRRQLGAEE